MKAKFPVSSFQFRRSKNACSGIALIGIIIAIVLMGLLGGSVLMLITTGSMESLQTLNWNKAFFAAESGISAAKYQMSTNATWYTALPRTSTGLIGRASFVSAIATNDGTNVTITSTGIQDDVRWTSKWYPAASEITHALLAYQQSGQSAPRCRTYSNLRRLGNEFTANSVAAVPQWQRIAANPLTNEFMLVSQNGSRRIYAQAYTNGTWGPATLLNNAGQTPTASARGFDVAYESLSGQGLAVYSIGSATPHYRIWTSGGWSSDYSVGVTVDGPIYWVRLVSRPGANEIMCLARWRASNRNYSGAIIWNGTTWINPIRLEDNCNSQINYEQMDGTYTTNSALVIYINGSSASQMRSPKYRTYADGEWSDQSTMDSLGYIPYWMRVEYSPDGSLAYAGFQCYVNGSNRRLRGAYWDGNIWGSYNTFSNVNLDVATRRCFDIAWSSQDNTLMVAYSLNQNAQSYLLATDGGSSNRYGNMVATDDGQWCVLKADPFTSEFYYLAIDDANDVNFQRWTGTAWTLFPELEGGSSLSFLSLDFAFRLDSASRNCWPLK